MKSWLVSPYLTSFLWGPHTKSFAPSSRQQRKNPSLLMCWLIISRSSYNIQLCTWIKGYLIFSISYCSIVREENTVQRWDTAYVFLDVGQSSQFWVVTLQYIYKVTIQWRFVEVVHLTVTVNNLSWLQWL